MEQKVYRIAPSPTGSLHIGTVRTALVNYLLARNSGAKFLLRIEDTDASRSTKEFEDNIVEGLSWLGIEWDEFHRQSERKGNHLQYAKELLAQGKAYLDGNAFKFRMPDGKITYVDQIRGELEFDLGLLEDIVLIKSDGTAGFLWANTVDDHDLGITNVVRGEDHISNVPKQLVLFQAMGWKPPTYAHISLILGEDRSKLSKRNGAKSVSQFRDEGYLPEAVFNFLALLGWSHSSGREILTKQEIIDDYTIDRVSNSNSVFDITKLEWINQQYIRNITDSDFAKYTEGNIALAKLIKERITTLADIPALMDYARKPSMYEFPKPSWIMEFVDVLRGFEGNFKDCVLTAIKSGMTTDQEMYTQLRYGITGKSTGFPLFQLMELLGKEEIINRLESW